MSTNTRMFKRCVAIMLAASVMVLSLLASYPLNVQAATTTTNLTSTTTAKQLLVGETFDVTIDLGADSTLNSFTGGISFDSTKIQYQGYKGNSTSDKTKVYLTKSSGSNPNVEIGAELGAGSNTFGLYYVGNSSNTYMKGNLVTITFKAIALGDANIKLYEDSDGTSGKQTTGVAPSYTVKVVTKCTHSMTPHSANAATCTEAGNSAYYYCSECNKYYSDANGNTQITKDSWILKATGHTMSHTSAKAATCTEAGNYEYYYCSECKKYFNDNQGTNEYTNNSHIIAKKSHSTTHTSAKAATCTEAGNYEYYYCSECKKYYKESACTNEYTNNSHIIAAKGHTMSHTAANAATCTATGNYEYYYCSECKKYFKDNQGTNEYTNNSHIIAKKSHSTAYTAAKAATCTEAGNNAYYYCSECKKYYKDSACTNEYTNNSHIIAAKGHTMSHTSAKAATCTEAGNYEYYYCSVCKKYFKDSAGTNEYTNNSHIIAAKGHTMSHTAAKAATCTEAGNYEYYYCSVCKKYFKDNQGTNEYTNNSQIIAAKGHSMTYTAAKAADCTTAGNTAYYYCSACKKYFSDSEGKTEITQASTVTKATGHSLTYHAANAATYSTTGNSAYYSCSKCGKYFSDSEGKTEIAANSWIIPKKNASKAGWNQDAESGNWYYLDSSLNPVKGWKQISKVWYYFNTTTGAMYTGMQSVDGTMYLFSSSGAMMTGWQKVSGTYYYFTSSGVKTGWFKSGTTWYYLDPSNNGAMVTGWQTIGGQTYFFASSGAMKTGWQSKNGTYYYCTSSGLKTGWFKSGSTWYYLDPSNGGAMVTGIQTIGGSVYGFASSGAMKTGWFQSGSDWYYLQSSGVAKAGWVKSGGKWYYFDKSNGYKMLYSTTKTIDGVSYTFDANGAMK